MFFSSPLLSDLPPLREASQKFFLTEDNFDISSLCLRLGAFSALANEMYATLGCFWFCGFMVKDIAACFCSFVSVRSRSPPMSPSKIAAAIPPQISFLCRGMAKRKALLFPLFSSDSHSRPLRIGTQAKKPFLPSVPVSTVRRLTFLHVPFPCQASPPSASARTSAIKPYEGFFFSSLPRLSRQNSATAPSPTF